MATDGMHYLKRIPFRSGVCKTSIKTKPSIDQARRRRGFVELLINVVNRGQGAQINTEMCTVGETLLLAVSQK